MRRRRQRAAGTAVVAVLVATGAVLGGTGAFGPDSGQAAQGGAVGPAGTGPASARNGAATTQAAADPADPARPAAGAVRGTSARHVGTAAGRPVQVLPARAGTDPERTARSFLRSRQRELGVEGADLQVATVRGRPGHQVVRFQQRRAGLPVLGGQAVVTVTGSGGALSASAVTGRAPARAGSAPAGTAAARSPLTAAQAAAAAVKLTRARQRDVAAADLVAATPRRWWYDPALLPAAAVGKRSGGFPVWQVEVTSRRGGPVRQVALLDAANGGLVLTYDAVAHLRAQVVCDHANVPRTDLHCTSDFARRSGGPPSAVAEVNKAWDAGLATYDFYRKHATLDLADLIGSRAGGSGKLLRATVRACAEGPAACPWQNAFWDGTQMVYGDGFAGADDVVGHEMTHGVTERTSGLFYYQESGALNEALSDIFGELVDLTDGLGNDAAAVRWQVGEDAPGGAIRDMKDPGRFGQPDRMTSPKWHSAPDDGGGVHVNSGVANKAAQLLVDGGAFNGQQVTGLGVDKAARIFWEVQNRLTPGATYADLHRVLPQACRDLATAGELPAADCAQADKIVAATEMDKAPVTAPPPAKPAGWCPTGTVRGDYVDDPFEVYGGTVPLTANWNVQGHWGMTKDWNPGGGQGVHALPGPSAPTVLSLTHPLDVPAGVRSYLRFDHALGLYDSGVVVETSADGKAWTSATFVDNGYNGTLADGKTKAFTGESHRWLSSRADLAGYAGKQVYVRFRIPAVEFPAYGWWLDNLVLYGCGDGKPSAPGTPDLAGAEAASAELNWAPPAYLRSKVSAYRITATPGNLTAVVKPTPAEGSQNGALLTGKLAGLKAGTTYTLTVAASTDGKQFGPASRGVVAVGTVLTLAKPAAPAQGRLTLTGKLTEPGGKALPAGRFVTVEARTGGTGAWVELAAPEVKAAGAWSATVPYVRNREYRAVFVDGEPVKKYLGSVSAAVKVP